MLYYGLEAIADAGITDVGIVVGETAAAIQDAVGDGSAWGLKVIYIRQEAPLGLAHAVLISRDYLGDDPFVMWLGDSFLLGGTPPGLTEPRFRASQPDALVMLTPVAEPSRFGVAELDEAGTLVSAWRRSRASPRATWRWSASSCSPRRCMTWSPA